MCLGLCLEMDSPSAHRVILARAMGIPVVGMGPAITTLAEGTIVAMDGQLGTVWISPGADQVQSLKAHRDQWLADRRI